MHDLSIPRQVYDAGNPTEEETGEGERGAGAGSERPPSPPPARRASAWHLNFARRRSGYPVDCQIGTAEARLGEPGRKGGILWPPRSSCCSPSPAPPFALPSPLCLLLPLSWDRHPEQQNSGSGSRQTFFFREEPTGERLLVSAFGVCVWGGVLFTLVKVLITSYFIYLLLCLLFYLFRFIFFYVCFCACVSSDVVIKSPFFSAYLRLLAYLSYMLSHNI